MIARLRDEDPEVARRELALLAGAVALGFVLQLIYVLAIRHYKLAGDGPEYDAEAMLITSGKWFYTRLPYGILHAGAWKAPLYPAWIALLYELFGHHLMAVRLVQIPVGLTTIPLSWLLARRLFGPRVATVAAFVVAAYPLVWQWDGLLYPEALAVPMTVALALLVLTGPLTARRALGFGLLLGVTLLLRPTTEFVLLGTLVAWCLREGFVRGLQMTVLAGVVAVIVVAPWTIRNEIVMHGFVPISMQDSAAYGTFNPQSASDSVYPYAWRDDPAADAYLFNPAHPLSDVTLRSKLIHSAFSYIGKHPGSVPAAFFWNGLSRLWDVRHQSHALSEVKFEGRSRFVTEAGLDIYYVLLPLALIGLWRARRRRWLVLGLLALALGASIVFTVDSGTRYRAPLEPLIVMFACVGVLGEPRAGLGETRAGTEIEAAA